MALIVAGRPVPDWMSTLDRMVAERTQVRFTCQADGCRAWRDMALADLVARYGPAGSLWDQAPACEACGAAGFYLASPSPGTVFRPLLSASQASRKLGR